MTVNAATETVDIERAILRVKAGSVDDYRVVVAAFHLRLRAALVGMCPPQMDHEEIAHLALIEAYRNLGRYTSNTNFFAWLCAIARHRVLAESKRLLRQAKNESYHLDHAVTQQLLFAVEQREEFNDQRFRLLEECIALLKPDAHSLICRRYDQHQSVTAIAQFLGKSVSAVSVQLFAIRAKLRDCVNVKMQAASNP